MAALSGQGVLACSGDRLQAIPTSPSGVDASAATADASGEASSSIDAATPFQPDPPAVYVAKVKNILVGLPPTGDEVKAVTADPTQLASLIDGWMMLPQYTAKLQTFFSLAFQQTQVSAVDFSDMTYPRQLAINGTTTPALVNNARESFPRTALELMAESRPFNETMTTTRFMMTTALMELYGFLDSWQVDDTGAVTDRFRKMNPKLAITVEASAGPVPLSQTLDPASPNYMNWYDPDVATDLSSGVGCGQDPITYGPGSDVLHYLLYGSLIGRPSPTGGTCAPISGTATAPQFAATDFSDWRMITVRPPAAGEASTTFYDLTTLRTAKELVLATPRVGFFSTPAFAANWHTNTSNQMRVTINQALIVALGAQVDGTDPTMPTSMPGLDTTHASDPACLACHQTLDPTRSILSATYSWYYHEQTDPTLKAQPGLFAFRGVNAQVASVADLGATLASHPLMPSAWVQKLCYYVNSGKCETDDPEFLRIVGVFQSSNLSFNALVRELMSSPLVTNAGPTQTTADQGETVAVSRRDHLCAALDARLGLNDVCGLDVLSKSTLRTVIPQIVSGLPSDGYGRGAVAPVLPNAPTLFYRAGTENICEAVAALVIDAPAPANPPGVKAWSSAQPDAAIAEFVGLLLGLVPSDPRSGPALSLLQANYAAAIAANATPSNALKSTFVAACLAPSSISIGL